jgi:hypothetical protein
MATNVAQSHRGAMVSIKHLFVIEDNSNVRKPDRSACEGEATPVFCIDEGLYFY